MRKRHLTTASCVVVLTFVLLGPAPAGHAAFPGMNGRIAFSYGDQFAGGDLGFHTDIYTVRPDGTGLKQITHMPDDAAAALPSFSPDGSKVAFESNVTGNYEIWVVDGDGNDAVQLTQERRHEHLAPSWSPDSSQIVFNRCDEPFGFVISCDVDVMDADGSNTHRVVGGHRVNSRPVFSPDGSMIAFSSDRAGLVSAVWVANADGTGLHRLTRPKAEAFWPDWSPNGERILFTDNCCLPHSNLWSIELDGSGLTRLTDATPDHNLAFGSYSPSGRQIVLMSDEAYSDFCCTDLVVRKADGSLSTVVQGASTLILATWGPAT